MNKELKQELKEKLESHFDKLPKNIKNPHILEETITLSLGDSEPRLCCEHGDSCEEYIPPRKCWVVKADASFGKGITLYIPLEK